VTALRTAARPPQGEALVVWAIWLAAVLAVLVTYARLDPGELYHTSEDGLAGGLGRALVVVNFPVALVAVALMLVALTALPSRAWLLAGPAIAACWVVPWVVDQDDLDARAANAIPALGVLVALGLTVAATRRAGTGFAPRLPGDSARVVVALVVGLLSLPWIAAELGFHFPGDVLMGEEVFSEGDGTLLAAVHLGHHHGTDGALLVLTALLLSRVRVRAPRLRLVLAAYLGLTLAYGLVNCIQDFWFEQIVKRGWTDASIPSVLLPGLRPIWGVVILLGAAASLALLREDEKLPRPASYSAP
jgi:hypothetical protein